MAFIVLDTAVRSLVIIALVYGSLVALTHWAVRTRRINPFGAWPRLVRRVSDPVVLRLEKRIIGAGGTPQNAPLWLLGLVIAAGLVLLSLTHWAIGMAAGVSMAVRGGPRVWLRLLVSAIFTVLM